MPDIAMCANSTCPHKNTCYRALCVPTHYLEEDGTIKVRQSYSDFTERLKKGKCHDEVKGQELIDMKLRKAKWEALLKK